MVKTCRKLIEYLLDQKEVLDKYFLQHQEIYNSAKGKEKQRELTRMYLIVYKDIYCNSAIKAEECPNKGLCEKIENDN